MTKGEAIDALGLRRYRERILSIGPESGSSGQLHTEVRLGGGYHFYFIESAWDGRIIFRLKTPDSDDWQEVRISEPK